MGEMDDKHDPDTEPTDTEPTDTEPTDTEPTGAAPELPTSEQPSPDRSPGRVPAIIAAVLTLVAALPGLLVLSLPVFAAVRMSESGLFPAMGSFDTALVLLATSAPLVLLATGVMAVLVLLGRPGSARRMLATVGGSAMLLVLSALLLVLFGAVRSHTWPDGAHLLVALPFPVIVSALLFPAARAETFRARHLIVPAVVVSLPLVAIVSLVVAAGSAVERLEAAELETVAEVSDLLSTGFPGPVAWEDTHGARGWTTSGAFDPDSCEEYGRTERPDGEWGLGGSLEWLFVDGRYYYYDRYFPSEREGSWTRMGRYYSGSWPGLDMVVSVRHAEADVLPASRWCQVLRTLETMTRLTDVYTGADGVTTVTLEDDRELGGRNHTAAYGLLAVNLADELEASGQLPNLWGAREVFVASFYKIGAVWAVPVIVPMIVTIEQAADGTIRRLEVETGHRDLRTTSSFTFTQLDELRVEAPAEFEEDEYGHDPLDFLL
jgi:hypothetical protein